MYELLLKIAFAVFLAGLLPSALHAVTSLSLRKTGAAQMPAWLVWVRRLANVGIGLGFIALTGSIVARWVEAGYPPFSNLPESLLLESVPVGLFISCARPATSWRNDLIFAA